MPVEQPPASAPPLPPAAPQNTPHPESAADSTTPANTARARDRPLRLPASLAAATSRLLDDKGWGGALDEQIMLDGLGTRLTRIRKLNAEVKGRVAVASESRS
jgi:hypothetical protein